MLGPITEPSGRITCSPLTTDCVTVYGSGEEELDTTTESSLVLWHRAPNCQTGNSINSLTSRTNLRLQNTLISNSMSFFFTSATVQCPSAASSEIHLILTPRHIHSRRHQGAGWSINSSGSYHDLRILDSIKTAQRFAGQSEGSQCILLFWQQRFGWSDLLHRGVRSSNQSQSRIWRSMLI